jgi:hypothetical protein
MQRCSSPRLVTMGTLWTSALVLALTSCGIDSSQHFGEKTFGQTPTVNVDDAPRTPPTPKPKQNDPETPPVTPPVEPQPDPKPSEEKYDQVLSDFNFQGHFNFDSARRILRGPDAVHGEISQGGTIDYFLKQFLGYLTGDRSDEYLNMKIQQHSKGLNDVAQVGKSDGGDRISKFKKDPSQSGTQKIDWQLPSADSKNTCPSPFICAARIVWIPLDGATNTFCYRDHDTKEFISIPYNANPNFGSDAYKSVIGDGLDSSPFEVIKYVGEAKCGDPSAAILDVRLVTYKLALGNLSDTGRSDFLQIAVHKPLTATTEVVIDYSLFDSITGQNYLPKHGPFIDEAAHLNSRMKFFINDAEHTMVKIDRTVQSTMPLEGSQIAKFLRDTYGSWFPLAWVAERLLPPGNDTEGVQINYSFEFCTHLSVIKNPYNHCTGQVEVNEVE